MRTIDTKMGSFGGLVFAPDQPHLATFDGQRYCRLWNATTGELLGYIELRQTYDDGDRACFFPNRRLFVAHYKSWGLLNLISGDLQMSAELASHRWHGHSGPTGEWVFCLDQEGILHAYTCDGVVVEKRWATSITAGNPYWPSPSVAADGLHVYLMGRLKEDDDTSVRLRAFRLNDGVRVAEWPCPRMAERHVQLSTDGCWAASHSEQFVALWDLTKPNTMPVKFKPPTKRYTLDFAFAPTGDKFATIAIDRCVRLYHRRTGEWTSFSWSIGELTKIRFSADGTLAAVSGEHGKIVVWDAE